MRIHLGLLAAALLSSSALAQQSQRADLCAELAAYVNSAGGQKPADAAPTQQQATAVQAPAQGAQRPQPGGTDNPQQTSGVSGPVTQGGTGAPGPQGQAQESSRSGQDNPQAGGRSEPAANRPPAQPGQAQNPPAQQAQQQSAPPAAAAAPQAPPPTQDQLQAAHQAIDSHDPLACRDAAQKMRRAGVNLPAALMTLAALDPKILKPDAGGAGGNAPASP